MKVWFRNLTYNIKRLFKNLYINAYGMDDLNKYLIYIGFILSIINIFVKNSIVYILSMIMFICFMYRYFSRNKLQRSAENRMLRRQVKYLEVKKQYSKTHKVFRCKKCGQLIKVPRGVGKVETTCPSCGNKEDHKA